MIALFQEENPSVSLQFLCEKLEISRSWFYERSAAGVAERTMVQTPHVNDVDLRHAIEKIALEFPCYGYRRITAQLARDGWIGERTVNHKRVLRVMQEESLLCHLKKRFVTTTDSGHGRQTYPNHLKGLL